ncbi:MAG: oligosaccharide flippase family protein [Pseudomonadota bacterium]
MTVKKDAGASPESGSGPATGGLGTRLASASSWSIGGQLAAKLLDLATLVVLLYFLTPADFGLVAQALTIVVIVEAVTMVPIQTPILRIAQPERALYDTAFTLTLLRAVLIGAIMALCAVPLAAYFREPDLPPLLYALALAPMVRGCLSPMMAEFDRRYDLRPYAVMEVTAKTTAFCIAVTIAATTASYWAIAAATITTPLVLATISYVLAPYRPRLSLVHFASFRDIVGWNTAAQAIETVTWQLDRLMLGRALPNDVFGRYAASRQINEIPQQSISRPLTRPMIAAFAQAQDQARLRVLWLKCSNTMLFVVGPIVVGLALLADEVVRVIFGPGWEGAEVFIFGLALAVLPQLPWMPLRSLAVATYRTRLQTFCVFIKLMISIPVLVIAIKWQGVIGAIIAKVLIEVAMIPISAHFIHRLIGVSILDQLWALRRTVAGLIALAVMLSALRDMLMPAFGTHRLVVAMEGGVIFGLAFLGYLSVVFGLWWMAGRPNGIESLMIDRATAVLAVLRRRLA